METILESSSKKFPNILLDCLQLTHWLPNSSLIKDEMTYQIQVLYSYNLMYFQEQTKNKPVQKILPTRRLQLQECQNHKIWL